MNLLDTNLRNAECSPALRARLGDRHYRRITALGNLDHVGNRLLALFCSTKCPGSLILDTYDLARALRGTGVTVIGGFHSPMEKECLDLLLRGKQPIVICPARGLQRMRIPPTWKKPLESGRLLILSPFGEKHRRATADLAAERNQFVAALSDGVFIAHAASGSKTEKFCLELIARGTSVFVLDRKDNQRLLDCGARALDQSEFLRGRGLSGGMPVSPHPVWRDMAWQS